MVLGVASKLMMKLRVKRTNYIGNARIAAGQRQIERGRRNGAGNDKSAAGR
jgi:hypothetical protein